MSQRRPPKIIGLGGSSLRGRFAAELEPQPTGGVGDSTAPAQPLQGAPYPLLSLLEFVELTRAVVFRFPAAKMGSCATQLLFDNVCTDMCRSHTSEAAWSGIPRLDAEDHNKVRGVFGLV